MTMAVTRTDAGWELMDNIVGALLGSLMLAGLFALVLVDVYQPDRSPIIPMFFRAVLAMTLWAGVAAALGYLRPEGSWRWGVRLALPAVVVLGFLALNNSGGLWAHCILFLLLAVGCGCGGGWYGARCHSPDEQTP